MTRNTDKNIDEFRKKGGIGRKREGTIIGTTGIIIPEYYLV
jgi:hypothetical protein